MPVGVGGDQSVVGALDIEDRMERREVDREAAEPRVVEDTEVRVSASDCSPGRRVLVELLEARRHGRFGRRRLRSRRRMPRWYIDPKARSRWSGAICQAPTPPTSRPRPSLPPAKRHKGRQTNPPARLKSPSRNEPSPWITRVPKSRKPAPSRSSFTRPGLAQAVVHDAGWRGVGEADGIDADADAHARQHRIVQRRGAAEVGVIDPVGAAVVEVEAADLASRCRGPTARCRRVRRRRRRRT